MKKLTSLFVLLILAGCTPSDFEPRQEPAPAPTVEDVTMGTQYIVTIEVKQSHFTIDPFEHLKDEMNAVEIEVAVSKEYYDAVDIGTVLDDSFRMGSLILGNSIGSWDVTIIDKEIR